MFLARTFIASVVLQWIAQANAVTRNTRAKGMKGSSTCKSKGGKGKSTSPTGVEGQVYEGRKIPIGENDSLMWSFVEWDDEGNPAKVGVKFQVTDFTTDLPSVDSDGKWDVRDASGATTLAQAGHENVPFFPNFQGPAADKMVFQHASVNWNPNGHGPPMIYDSPHFDFHFFLISNLERNTCIQSPLNTEQCETATLPDECQMQPPFLGVDCDGANFAIEPLPEDMMPDGYVVVCAVEPGMGDHLIRPAAPEISGGADFTHTWIWGRQGGYISFWEPMITADFLDTVRDNYGNTNDWYDADTYLGAQVSTSDGDGIMVPIPGLTTAAGDPITQARAGLYPTSYRILYDAPSGVFTVDLVGFEELCETEYPSDLTCPDFVPKLIATSKGGKRSRRR